MGKVMFKSFILFFFLGFSCRSKKDFPSSPSVVVAPVGIGLDAITLSEPPITTQFKDQTSFKVKVHGHSKQKDYPLRGEDPESEARAMFARDSQEMRPGHSMALCLQTNTNIYHKLVVESTDPEFVFKKVMGYCQRHQSLLLVLYFKIDKKRKNAL